jgi:hypothetical protein
MKKILASIIILLVSGSSALSDDTVWVPIMLDGITFFVPLGFTPAQPPVTPPPVPPLTSPFADANLQNCVDNAMQVSGWQSFDQITELYCVAANISNISGIDTLVNLDRLALGDNNISDISSLYNMQSLTWLHLSSFSYTNTINNSDIAGLGNLNLTYLAVPSYSYEQGTELNVSAFPNGFNSMETLRIDVQDDFIDCDTLYQIQQRWNFLVNVQFFSSDNICQQN